MILFPYYVYLIFIIIPTLATSPGQRERERERETGRDTERGD